MNRRQWSPKEDELIRNLIQELGTQKWPLVALNLVRQTKTCRTGKQCRERWYNHLCPQINKEEWTATDDQVIFQAHQKHGNKWKLIAQLLEGRTDNTVKNHFYSALRRSLRRINKFLGEKNSTIKMKEIKPAVLAKILQDKALTQSIFEFGQLKPSKGNNKAVNEAAQPLNRDNFMAKMQKLVAFNEKYTDERKQQAHRIKSTYKARRTRCDQSLTTWKDSPDQSQFDDQSQFKASEEAKEWSEDGTYLAQEWEIPYFCPLSELNTVSSPKQQEAMSQQEFGREGWIFFSDYLEGPEVNARYAESPVCSCEFLQDVDTRPCQPTHEPAVYITAGEDYLKKLISLE